MLYMLVTLDVSKLSGWLNTYALCMCRKEGMRCGGEVRDVGAGGHTKRDARWDGWWEGLGLIREDLVQEWVVIVGGECLRRVRCGSRWRPAAHQEHGAHVPDAGRVEGQRLVEGRRALPSRKKCMRCGGEVRNG